jgi:hypothetical protein
MHSCFSGRAVKAHGLLVSAGADVLRSGLGMQCTVSELKVNYR